MLFELSASILAADFACLGAQCQTAISHGVTRIHFDVMDNHYVPNLTVGPMVCAALRAYGIKVAIDVHLMIKPLDRMLEAFARAGATTLTIHPECCNDLGQTLQTIKQLNCAAGVALNPGQSFADIEPHLSQCQEVLLMAVEPGFGGQKFQPETLETARELQHHLTALPTQAPVIAIDGGINASTLPMARAAGVSRFVAGSALFAAKPEIMQQQIETLLGAMSLKP